MIHRPADCRIYRQLLKEMARFFVLAAFCVILLATAANTGGEPLFRSKRSPGGKILYHC